ncbi:PR domain zinc finger protein 2-like [Hyposmocoma kahamanoa]|uniref:PR domain zinc finger protein 2-like n=1 Tax=Hyposmocoma kahamanoa TaxID=1477025 RepID=UPI000E6D9CB6|nr:PR domain zinc finger protein 2-like [Hyposmocoma kahamanoa]
MVLINDFTKKDCFSQLCSEFKNSRIEDEKLILCWVCSALVSRFAKFKAQVREAHWRLEKSVSQHTSRPRSLTTFHSNRLFNINIIPTEYEYNKPNFKYEVIKHEINPDISIKEELENIIINDSDIIHSDSDDDNKLLIDFKKIKSLKETSIVRKKRKNGEEIFKEIELTKEEINEERKELSLQEEYINAMFRCERCVISFPNADDLNDHVNAKHELNASSYKCKICECTFLTEVSYNYHTNRHTKRYQCNICAEWYLSKRAVIRHYEMLHCQG